MYTMYTRNMPTLWYIRRERTAAFYEEKSQDLNLKKKYVKDIHASLELLIWITCPDNPALEWPSCPYGCLSKSLNSYEADQLSLLLVSLFLYLELPCSFPPWKSQAVKYQIHVLELDIVSSVRQICSLQMEERRKSNSSAKKLHKTTPLLEQKKCSPLDRSISA